MTRWLQPEYLDSFPLSFLMRERFPKYWLRIHSLPESKRYPEDEAEREIVLQRYASFGTALLGDQAPCLIVRARFATEDLDSKFRGSLSWSRLHKIEEEDDFWCSWVAEISWRPETLRDLLIAIAEDRDSHVLFVSKLSDSIFAPYDGGADGFSFDSGLITRFKQEFQPWLSARADGL
jgi:hypothetical protein